MIFLYFRSDGDLRDERSCFIYLVTKPWLLLLGSNRAPIGGKKLGDFANMLQASSTKHNLLVGSLQISKVSDTTIHHLFEPMLLLIWGTLDQQQLVSPNGLDKNSHILFWFLRKFDMRE